MALIALMEDTINAYKIFVGKPESKRPLKRVGRIFVTETAFQDVDCIHVIQDRDQCRDLVNTVMNNRVSQKAVYFLTS